MKLTQRFLVLLILVVVFSALGQMTPSPELGRQMAGKIEAFHKEASSAGQTLKVVYFHAADQPPLAGYADRMDRILKDIQSFYRNEMERNGFGKKTFPLELDENGKLRLHVVKGGSNADAYSYASGDLIRREVKRAVKGTFDVEREFVLIICGLCREKEDGTHVFHSPYYGLGADQTHGLCFAADSRLQDTLHYEDTKTRFRYEEHLGQFEKSLGDFNTLYIGGIAHELGHGLSLPHNGESGRDRGSLGLALMGSGNFSYRSEKRGGKGSFMTLASCLRLAVHPLFTRTRKQVDAAPDVSFIDLSFAQEGTRIGISGRVRSVIETIGVIAYVDPPGRQNYDARTWVGEVVDGRFLIPVNLWADGDFQLRLATVHANGAVVTRSFSLNIPKDRQGVAKRLNGELIVQKAVEAFASGDKERLMEFEGKELNEGLDEVSSRKLRHLLSLRNPVRPLSLADTQDKEAWLSDAEWRRAETAWGKPTRNAYDLDVSHNNPLLMLGGEFHEKGLYAHARSRYVFDLDGRWKKLTTLVGLQNGGASNSSGVFIIKGDGRELHRTKLIKGSETERIEVSLNGVKQLELIVESGKENNHACWTVWGSPRVTR